MTIQKSNRDTVLQKTRLVFTFLVMGAVMILAGCQAELYSNLQEREANEMVAILSANGIEASRTSDGKGNYGLNVRRSDFADAIAKLSEKGLPRENYKSLGNVFNSDKLVSTPFEERARFMYALNQELSDSISRINGVVSARVHLMVPETSPFEKKRSPPRASVFIYQEVGSDLQSELPMIKNLIVNSLENLEYSNVEVALFDYNSGAETVGGFNAGASLSSFGFWNMGLIVLLGILAWFGLNYSSRKNQPTDKKQMISSVKQK